MSEIIFYQCPMTRSAIARWTLEEVGAPYRAELIDVREGVGGRTPEFEAINPMGKVPAIKDGEVTVAENAAIGLYLADAYPDAGLAPPIGDPLRGRYLQWCVWSPGCLEPALMQRAMKFETARPQAAWGDPELVMDVLADAVRTGPWLLGERFTVADVLVGSGIIFGLQFDLLPERPEYLAYRDRLIERPARQRATQLEEAAAA